MVVDTAEVTIELDGRTVTTTAQSGFTLLQTARQAGLNPPSSCEAGNCATCAGQVTEGEVQMRVNDVLEDDEVAEGYVLTCQGVPTSSVVRITYDVDF